MLPKGLEKLATEATTSIGDEPPDSKSFGFLITIGSDSWFKSRNFSLIEDLKQKQKCSISNHSTALTNFERCCSTLDRFFLKVMVYPP